MIIDFYNMLAEPVYVMLSWLFSIPHAFVMGLQKVCLDVMPDFDWGTQINISLFSDTPIISFNLIEGLTLLSYVVWFFVCLKVFTKFVRGIINVFKGVIS